MDDDDWALDMFEAMEARKRTMLVESEQLHNRWWIVMHSKVAVRPGPSREGEPVCLLPRGSVLKAETLLQSRGGRWMRIHPDELHFLKRKSRPAPSEAYMLLDTPEHGALLTDAPKEFDWDTLTAMHPRERGEAARQQVTRMHGAPSVLEATDADIQRLLSKQAGAADDLQDDLTLRSAKASEPTRMRNTTENIGLRAFSDGLVDVDVGSDASTRRRYDDITATIASAQRERNAKARAAAKELEQQHMEEEKKRQFARAQRSKLRTEDGPDHARLARLGVKDGEVRKQLEEDYWYLRRDDLGDAHAAPGTRTPVT